jgi:hypothetical protein
MRSSLFVLVLSLSAFAQSVDRASLERSIKQSRSESPAVFARVRSIVEQADTLQHRARGRLFPFPAQLRAVTKKSPGAAFALVEPLIAPERFAMPSSPDAKLALRAGLLEAAGSLQESSLAPLYRSLITTDEPREVSRAAAEALAKLGVDEDAVMLSRLAVTEGPLQDAAISALGSASNGKVAVAALSSLAATPLEVPRAKLVAGSLARVAAGWNAVTPWRAEAAKGALTLFVNATSDEVRAAASDALMIIDAPETPVLIAAAGSNPALIALQTRFANNPTRSHR